MYLVIIFPLLILTAVGGVLALMHEHPDHVINSHRPYDEPDHSYENELGRVA